MINKVGIFYFSGTGNTEIISNILKDEFNHKNVEVDIFKIDDILKKSKTVNISSYDIIGIGYPVHAFNAPKIMIDFAKILPKSINKKVFIFKTAGDPSSLNYNSSSLLISKLKYKGYEVFYEKLITMPSNMIIKYNDNLVKQIYNSAIKKTKNIVEEIQLNKINIQKSNYIIKLLTIFSRLE